MGKRLYVGNLPYQTTAAELRDEFGRCGVVVDSKVVTDRETGQSKGFAFVEFDTESEAQQAIETFDGADFGGRNLRVNVAEPKGAGGPRPTNGGSQDRSQAQGAQQGYSNQGPRNYPQNYAAQDNGSRGGNNRGKHRGGGRGRRGRYDDDSTWD